MSPNGHGGSLQALLESGAVENMKRRGIDTISYFQVDNPLTTICDPVFAGYHLQAEAGMSSKVLRKRSPDEKVGVVVLQEGRTGVIEYSDLDEDKAQAVDGNGELLYWAGSIAIHMLSVDFVESVGRSGLPWHVAVKKIPFLNAQGQLVRPEEPNGVKFETFVFDALPFSDASVTMEVAREVEFAPVKNAEGTDSVESSRRLLSDYAARLLKEGETAEGNLGDGLLELSPLFALDAEEAKARRSGPISLNDGLVLEGE
jgi:UDP-N-acetylglucosamine/UDP-N-acetylgalactosamine diphosphorylase